MFASDGCVVLCDFGIARDFTFLRMYDDFHGEITLRLLFS